MSSKRILVIVCCLAFFLGGGHGAVRAQDAGESAEPAPAVASVELVSVHGSGFVTDDVIRQVYEEGQAEIVACYEQALAETEDLAGEASFTWWFRSDGSLFRTTVPTPENQLNHEGLQTCITDRMAGWPFPPPPGGESQLGRATMRLRFTPAP